MPTYSMNHIHHEAKDVHAAAEWYKKLFDASSDEPFERGGATWIRVHVGDVTVTITDREFSDTTLESYQGYDHLALDSDDFDGTLARIEECGAHIFKGPMDAGGFRIVFVDGPDNVKIELMEKV